VAFAVTVLAAMTWRPVTPRVQGRNVELTTVTTTTSTTTATVAASNSNESDSARARDLEQGMQTLPEVHPFSDDDLSTQSAQMKSTRSSNCVFYNIADPSEDADAGTAPIASDPFEPDEFDLHHRRLAQAASGRSALQARRPVSLGSASAGSPLHTRDQNPFEDDDPQPASSVRVASGGARQYSQSSRDAYSPTQAARTKAAVGVKPPAQGNRNPSTPALSSSSQPVSVPSQEPEDAKTHEAPPEASPKVRPFSDEDLPSPQSTSSAGIKRRSQSFSGAIAEMQESDDVVAKAKKLIEDHPCIIFSKSTCPFCGVVKTILLGDMKAKVEIFEVDKEVHWKQLDTLGAYLEEQTGARTFPRVFIQGKCVGGKGDVADLYKSGELRGMLEQAGAL